MKKIAPCFFILFFQLQCFFLPAQSNCIDLSNLNKPYIHCTWGDFWNPYLNQGIIEGRHTVITSQESDYFTNNQLMVIPPGESYSVRLGNSQVGSQAESISVDIAVDTNNFDLLILKYAAVMEDPNHSPSEQPRFTFDILDTQNHPIDPDCLSADFIANPSLGWNSAFSGDVLWKDWTNVGVDISEYHGQTIRVRLTTYDCSQSGHFGYAYFLLTCGQKYISIDMCGDVDEYSYSAPSGFNYRWFWEDDPLNVLSINQTITVPAGDNRRLICHVSFMENPSCGFNLSTTTAYRFPMSFFRVSENSCPKELHFINESAISNDGIHPDGTGNHCDDAFWDFGDGHTSTSFNPTHRYTIPGTYTVMMVAGLNGFVCTDTAYLEIVIPEDTRIDTLACDVFHWNGVTYTESGEYETNYTTSQGCDSLVILNLSIIDRIETSYNHLGCDSVIWNGIQYDISGLYVQSFQNSFGCDSIVTMYLDMGYTPDFTIVGDHWPIGGTELAWSQSTYHIALDHPLCVVDSVEWSVDCPTMFVFPQEDGLSCNLRIFSYLPPTDSVPLRAIVYNRCGREEQVFWVHTSYFGIEDHSTEQSGFSVYPNPSAGLLKMNMKGMPGEVRLTLYDSEGNLVDQWIHRNLSEEETLVYDASKLQNGLYTVKVCHDTVLFTRKIIVRK